VDEQETVLALYHLILVVTEVLGAAVVHQDLVVVAHQDKVTLAAMDGQAVQALEAVEQELLQLMHQFKLVRLVALVKHHL
jgi:bisphosphoglycerate-independent phosphoglycerate mutase (AlkP superfamily)